jgi:hypothetical protein
MKLLIGCFMIVVAGLAPVPCLAKDDSDWNRFSALVAVRATDTRGPLKSLFELAQTGNTAAVLKALSEVDQDRRIPAPARDYILFAFARGLGDQEPGAVHGDVLDFLSDYRPQTLVAQEDHPRIAVPLFNVKAAVAGVRRLWDRELAFGRARDLLSGPADRWITSYLAADASTRRGFIDALESTPAGQLGEVGWRASTLLRDKPELTLVCAVAALRTGDRELLQQSILLGGNADLPGILRTASHRLNAAEFAGLLIDIRRLGSSTKTALAIAQLAPADLGQPEIRGLLFDALSDPELGAAAAQVLGTTTDPDIQAQLAEIASQAGSLAARRARLAIRFHDTRVEERL